MSRVSGFLRDQAGVAAAEFALWLTALFLPIWSAVDLSFYIYQKMELASAAQDAAQVAWSTCSTSLQWPVTKNCANLLTNITAGAQHTSLGTNVTVVGGYPIEGYYCANASGVLTLADSQAIGTIPAGPKTQPTDCSKVVAGSKQVPGDYLQVQVSYTYTPIVGNIGITSLLTSPMTQTAWVRVN